MCTHNGAAFLAEQLASVASQTMKPAEMIIVDDASSDGTPEILADFAARAAFEVTVIRTPRNEGVTRCFERAMGATTGDLIALSDQDDRWQENKLETLTAILIEDPGVGFVFTDSHLMDADSRALTGTVWGSSRVDFLPGRDRYDASDAFEFHMRHSVVTGATSAMRGWLRDVALPFPADVGTLDVAWKLHDGWLALVAASRGSVAAISAPTMTYRVHRDQQIGLRGDGSQFIGHLTSRDHARLNLQHAESLLATTTSRSGPAPLPSVVNRLTDQRDHLRLRLGLDGGPLAKLIPVTREVYRGGYERWSGGKREALRDLLSRAW